MDQLLKCPICNTSYNKDTHSPRILPCDQQQCSSCIQSCLEPLGGFKINCECKQKVHRVNSIEDVPISQATMFFMNKSNQKNMLDQIKDEISQHYDDMEMKIDVRAETLIEFIHDFSDSLRAEIKSHRKNTNKELEHFQPKFDSDYEKLEKLTSKPVASSLQLKKVFEGILDLQRSIDTIKTRPWYFVQNSNLVKKSLLGNNFHSGLERNYSKIKNIKSLLSDKTDVTKYHQLNLKSQFDEVRMRHFVSPLNRNRTVNCYFSKNKSIHLELFDGKGQSIKLIEAVTDATYFPLVTNNANYFVLYYTARPKVKQSYLDDSSVGHVSLFDSELNLIKSITSYCIIES